MVAVVSDVHANTVALEAVLSELVPLEPDLVVFGGDLTWGPEPEETLALVAGLDAATLFVRGNADRMLLEEGDDPTGRKPWLLEHHSPTALAHLATFVEQATVEVAGLGRVRFCHGSPRSDEEAVTPQTPEQRVRAFMEGITEAVLVTAHTHLQFDRRVAGITGCESCLNVLIAELEASCGQIGWERRRLYEREFLTSQSIHRRDCCSGQRYEPPRKAFPAEFRY
jgi:predicted phosphodiesterase